MVYIYKNNFDQTFVKTTHINKHLIETQVKNLLSNYKVSDEENLKAWLLKAISVIDLTTLSGDDTRSNVMRLCVKAANPLPQDILINIGIRKEKINTAAVCVYPTRVKDAYETISRMGLENTIQIASVATAFPSGLCPLDTRLFEIKYALGDKATEIDVVIDRSLVLTGQWEVMFHEIQRMRDACGEAHLKVILGVGELGSYENIYKASMVAMFAGANFIKTSTGKEAVNATLPVGLVMCRAIRKFYQLTGIKVGLKPAGGIKTPQDAINWLILVNKELGPEWLTPKLFRIGASSLLGEIEKYFIKKI